MGRCVAPVTGLSKSSSQATVRGDAALTANPCGLRLVHNEDSENAQV